MCVAPLQYSYPTGPSGSGKTTLLNVLAGRTAAAAATVGGSVLVDGQQVSVSTFRRLTSYVEQEDALIGSLTVKETLDFNARLSLPRSTSALDRVKRIESLIYSFGLVEQANTLIGTPVRKGISGGQKRRVSVASALVSSPSILFLDEPTSGLDSAASLKVISYLKKLVKREHFIVIASIHQPSTTTFELFDKLLLLSGGKTCYFGPTTEIKTYFDSIGFLMPAQMNPAEFAIDLTNIDFAEDREAARQKLERVQTAWIESVAANSSSVEKGKPTEAVNSQLRVKNVENAKNVSIPFILLHRSFIKSYRDVFAYGVRLAMYMGMFLSIQVFALYLTVLQGLAVMMGTVWLRLQADQASIQSFINAIFFGSAFMSFMAVAYVPAFLEDRAMYVKERANGLYGPTSFVIANFLIGLPYLFAIAIIFSVITYWLANFNPSGRAFITWVMWLFLDLVAAESLVVLMSAITPIFVVALATTAFANGLWMSVNGFMVSPKILNVFWKYAFSYIDYQRWVFQGMMVNEFGSRNYSCGGSCNCIYKSALEDQCKIAGDAILDTYGYSKGHTSEWVGILIGIIAGMRILGWVALKYRT
jgi:ABC-type multidrug transport system ATPase subunit/ABC-type multidrug transport system permease subunit